MLASHSVGIFTTLIDKVGVDSVLECLSHNNGHIQIPVLTMISMLLNESSLKSLPEKVIILHYVNAHCFIQILIIIERN